MGGQIIPQYAGQAILIPAGTVHQVWNFQDNVNVTYNFLEPNSLHKYVQAHRDIHKNMFPISDTFWPDDRMGIYNVPAIEIFNRSMHCPVGRRER